MARNSAPITRNRPAAQTKERMRKRTECTGFLAIMTAKAETARTIAKIQKNQASACIVRLLSQAPPPVARTPRGKGAERRSGAERRLHLTPLAARTTPPAGQRAFSTKRVFRRVRSASFRAAHRYGASI